MGISASVAAWLKAQGYDAVHLDDENLNTLADNLIIDKAIDERRIILTSDMDFGQLLALNKSQQVSVIQFRISNFKPGMVRAKLELVFAKFHNQLDGDFIITVEDERIRFRNLPI